MGNKNFVLEVIAMDNAGATEIELATMSLRRELDAIGTVQAELVSTEPKLHAKSAGGFEIGQIALTLLGSGGFVVGVVAALKDWLLRNRRMKLRVKQGDQEVELEVAGSEELSLALASLQKMLDAKP